jgi:hypothetical protein
MCTRSPFSQSTPQQYLEAALNDRGYSIEKFSALNTGYYREPTPLQMASYDVQVLKMIVLQVHYSQGTGLHEVLSCGISPDACNKYGESLLHRVCKAGNSKLLNVFLEHGASVQFANDYGRTPLHEVCSATRPCFDAFEQVLKRDLHLIFLTDVRGATALSYIRKEHYDPWIRRLEEMLDKYWPRLRISDKGKQGPPPLASEKPRVVPLPDPVNALPVELAAMVASGNMDPLEATLASIDRCDETPLTSQEDAVMVLVSDPVNALPVELAARVASGTLEPLKAMLVSVDSCDATTLKSQEQSC